MHAINRLVAILLVVGTTAAGAQTQRADRTFEPTVVRPAYARGGGPRVVVDEAHHNFHTMAGRYAPFALLLAKDGFDVGASTRPLRPETLAHTRILVIANALNAANAPDKWVLPTPSAFSRAEIGAVTEWVRRGGSLLLIADHMPFAGAAHSLAAAFGVEFVNGYAIPADQDNAEIFTRDRGLLAHAITTGRGGDSAVTSVRTFTGSAFRAPRAAPLIRLDDRYKVYLTREAGEISKSTPVVPGDGLLQAAALTFGRGRVVICAEAAMLSSQLAGDEHVGFGAPGAEQNPRFVLNVMHWLARQPGY